jgi:flavin-dependent thymidylate synthase
MNDRAVLMAASPIVYAVDALRICKASFDKKDSRGDELGPADAELLRRVLALETPHESICEHVVYQFQIVLSRACLHEERRTRMSSPSVQSSRFTLGKMLEGVDCEIRSMLHQTGDEDVDALAADHMQNVRALHMRRKAAGRPVPNDKLKYLLVEAWLTVEMLTINARSLRNVFNTRMGKGVLAEYRALAWEIYDQLPPSHHILFEDIVARRERPA